MSKLTPEKWAENIAKVREIMKHKNHNQMQIAQLALEVCQIVHGGQSADKSGIYSLSRFGEEAGISVYLLSQWISVRTQVYDKLPRAEVEKVSYTQLAHVNVRIRKGASAEFVREKFDEIIKVNGMDAKMQRYIRLLGAMAYNFERQNAAEKMSEKSMQEILFFFSKMKQKIHEIKPGLRPKSHGICSVTSLYRASSFIRTLSYSKEYKGKAAFMLNGQEILVTPKDRDVLNWLRMRPRKFFGPQEISRSFAKTKKGRNGNSTAISTSLLKFVGTKYIERNKKGQYRWVGK